MKIAPNCRLLTLPGVRCQQGHLLSLPQPGSRAASEALPLVFWAAADLGQPSGSFLPAARKRPAPRLENLPVNVFAESGLDGVQESNQSRGEPERALPACQPRGASGKDQDITGRGWEGGNGYSLCTAPSGSNVTRYINNLASPSQTSDPGEHEIPGR